MAPEQLLFFLVLVLIPLLNYLVRVVRRRVDKEAPPPRPPEEVRARVLHPRPTALPTRAPTRTAIPPVPPAPARRRPRLTLQTVRQGIVLMTILAPCRGLEPAGRRERPPTRA